MELDKLKALVSYLREAGVTSYMDQEVNLTLGPAPVGPDSPAVEPTNVPEIKSEYENPRLWGKRPPLNFE